MLTVARRLWPRRIGAVLIVLTLAGASRSAAAAAPNAADTSREARRDAVNSIPFDELTDEMQQRLRSVVGNSSLYRRMPVQTLECDADMHVFLVRHPEVIIDIWRLMGITKCSIQRKGEFELHVSDGLGTVSDVELVYGTPGLHVMYGTGTYSGSFLRKPVEGRSVLVLKSDYVRGDDGKVKVTNRLDVFVRFDQVGAQLLAKTLYPLVGKTADHNFRETTRFVQRISEAAETNGPGVERLANKLVNVAPEVRREFAEMALLVNHRAALRHRTFDSGPRVGSLPTSNPDRR